MSEAVRSLVALARAVASSTVRAGASRGAALFAGIGIVAVIVFAPQGMNARDLTRAAAGDAGFRVGLWAAWMIAATPLARAVLVNPSIFYLRSLPVAPWQLQVLDAAALAVVETPWLALWTRGDGLLAGSAETAAAMATHAWVVARPRRLWQVAVAAGVVVLVLAHAPAAVLLVSSLAGGVPAMLMVWRRAPELGRRPRRARIFGPPALALARAHLASLRRGEAALIGRGVLVTLVGSGVAILAIRNNEVHAPATISAASLTIAAASLGMAGTALAKAALRVERSLTWILDATGTSQAARALAAAVAVGAWLLPLGAAHGALVSYGVGVAPRMALRLAGLGAVWGVVLGGLVLAMARLGSDGDDREVVHLLATTAALLAVAVAVGVAGETALAGAGMVALALGLLAVWRRRGAASLGG